jgi:MFS family permease
MGTRQHDQEREPLLRDGRLDAGEGGDARDIVTVSFSSKDSEDPRQWSRSKKLVNLGIIAQMALLSPLASSMISPGISQIAEDLGTTKQLVIGCTTVYVVALGISPLFLAPMSEVYGRRPLYLWCYAAFSLLQIPCALAPNIATLLAMRTLTGLFGAVGIANGQSLFVSPLLAWIFLNSC